MITKEKLKSTLTDFLEKFSIDELFERLILIEKIELGNQQSLNGEVISDVELDQEIEKWFE